MTRARIAKIVGSAALLIAVGSHFVATSNKHITEAASSLPDTTNNIHIGLSFDYNTTPSAYSGKVDYVWGSQYPGQPASVYHTFYIPYDRDLDTTYYSQAHNVTWWKANHPDWIEYKCDRTTVAYEDGATTYVPLDITNPAVMQYFEQTYVAPALSGTLPEFPGAKYDGIAFDNPNFQNAGSWTGQRCGHYDASGNWVQQFNGTSDDPAYRKAIISWAQSMQSWMHANFPNATMSVNFSYDSSFPTDSNTLLSYIDVDDDEQGFTNGNNGPPYYYADSQWLAKMQSLQNYLQSGHGLFSVNQEPVSFANVTNAQVQWVMANYLLIKNNASYLGITGYQQYGSLFLRPEYSAPIGSATDAMYQSQSVYMRDFTNGLAIVNPSSSQSYAITLPHTYQDLYGNTVNSVTLAPVSGIVLLGSNNTSAPTVTSAPTGTPMPTTTPTSVTAIAPLPATATTTPVPATATNTLASATATNTPVSAAAATTSTPLPLTSTPVPPTATAPATATTTPVPATATVTTTSVPATVTVTNTPMPLTSTPVPPSATAPTGPNLLQNASFENRLRPWSLYVRSDAAGTARATVSRDRTTAQQGTYSAKVAVSQAGPQAYYVALDQGNLALTGGQTYRVTFWAKADAPHQVQVVTQQNYSPWSSYASQTFDLTTSWQPYTMTFTQGATDANVELLFNVGQQTGDVWIDNVSLTPATP